MTRAFRVSGRVTAGVVTLLVLALLLSQVLGLVHGVVHGPQVQGLPHRHAGAHGHLHARTPYQLQLEALLRAAQAGRAQAVVPGTAPSAADAKAPVLNSHAHGGHDQTAVDEDHWMVRLFASHDGDGDCRLYDQASHGQAALHVATLSLPMVLSPAVFDLSRGEALARWAALFDARGPPLTA